jgi:hypothetical protein
VPLGYDVKDRKLIVNKAEARTVADIYRRYLVVREEWLGRAELGEAGCGEHPAEGCEQGTQKPLEPAQE